MNKEERKEWRRKYQHLEFYPYPEFHCYCPCNGKIQVKPHHFQFGIPKYLPGHFYRGRKRGTSPRKGKTYDEIYGDRAEEQKMKRRHPNSEEAKKNMKGHSGVYDHKPHSEETKAKMRGTAEKRWEDLEERRKQSERLKIVSKIAHNTPEAKANHSAAAKRRYEDPEERAKQSERCIGRPRSEETKQKNREAHLGKKLSTETLAKKSFSMQKRWQDPEFAKMMIEAQHRKPNNFEKQLDKFLQKMFPGEYQINVNAEVMILGGRCPDFVNISGQKKLIEANGDYWHGEKLTGRTKEEEEQQRVEYFEKRGYKTLVIWESDLLNLEGLQSRIRIFTDDF